MLIKIANAATRAFNRGALSWAGMRSLAKPPETILNGMAEGALRTIKKNGYTLTRNMDLMQAAETRDFGGAFTQIDWNGRQVFDVSKQFPIFHHFMSIFNSGLQNKTSAIQTLRHEAFETAAEKYNKIKSPHTLEQVLINKNNKPIGQHFNLNVLANESNDSRKLLSSGILPNDKLTKFRMNNGESDLLKQLTGKPYGSYFDKHDIRKLQKIQDKMMDSNKMPLLFTDNYETINQKVFNL